MQCVVQIKDSECANRNDRIDDISTSVIPDAANCSQERGACLSTLVPGSALFGLHSNKESESQDK